MPRILSISGSALSSKGSYSSFTYYSNKRPGSTSRRSSISTTSARSNTSETTSYPAQMMNSMGLRRANSRNPLPPAAASSAGTSTVKKNLSFTSMDDGWGQYVDTAEAEHEIAQRSRFLS
mmetsp:Transcript_452/g.1261  ORF Transcript_452/g.1261 Transcript_452/m.1261 type:complete len:120 (-) Transcript_452:690-1049(-)